MAEQRQLVKTLQIAIDNALANLHTATIAKVTAVNATTIDCQVVINRYVDGVEREITVFPDVPTVTLQGGGSYIQMPIAVGDYCLLVFGERCFDRWYEGQDNALPAEYRLHDYSDAVAIVGLNPRASEIANPSVITMIGDMFAQGNHEHEGNTTQTGDYTVTGNVTINGNLTVNGDINCTGKLTVASASIGGVEFGSHVHPENDNGGPTDGPQNP